jgi:prepilin signal peptidase PulO-like enzyme (type II secretory pathway)
MDTFEDSIIVTDTGRLAVVALGVVIGSIFGSFMNVVIYRLPLKLSLIRPASRCPRCEHPIRWHDNVPILGWFLLGGKCRDCQAPISVRYPAVEALTAVVSGLLAWKEGTIQIVTPQGYTGAWYSIDLAWYGFHLLLMYALICAALIEYDGHAAPRGLIRWPIVLGGAMLLYWKHLLPRGELVPVGGIAAAIVGALAALVIGAGPWMTWAANASARRFQYASGALGELVLVGFFLGDHAVMTIALWSMIVYVVLQVLGRKWPAATRFGWAGPLALVTLIWLLTEPDDFPFDPRFSDQPGIQLIIVGSILVVLAIVAQLFPPRRAEPKEA